MGALEVVVGCELMTCVRHATGLVGRWRAVTVVAERPRDRPGGAFSGAHRVVERGQGPDELLYVLGRRRASGMGAAEGLSIFCRDPVAMAGFN